MTMVPPNAQNLAYQAAPSADGGSYTERKLARLRLPRLEGKRFLDLGCNMGFYCAHALSQGAKRVLGVDVDKAMIEEARRLLPKVEFHDGGWDSFPEGEFDVVICLSAIHYAADPVRLVRNIAKQLAPDGLFVLEGGLVGVDELARTDLLVPSWRQVGDRCRHLSEPFVRRRLLQGFDWSIEGPSEMRGGDDIPRFVVHARRNGTAADAALPPHAIDLLEYARWLRHSAHTIVGTMPSYRYVTALGAFGEVGAPELNGLLREMPLFDAFVDDLLFALGGGRPIALHVLPTIDRQLVESLEERLTQAGIDVVHADRSP